MNIYSSSPEKKKKYGTMFGDAGVQLKKITNQIPSDSISTKHQTEEKDSSETLGSTTAAANGAALAASIATGAIGVVGASAGEAGSGGEGGDGCGGDGCGGGCG